MKILITGATSGIGRQLAFDYQSGGHEVWAIGRNEKALHELKTRGIHTAKIDLLNRLQALDWFRTQTVFDLAILNAGTCEYINLPNFNSDLVARMMRTNVESMAICIEGVLPLLRKGTRPHLVGMGSAAAYLPLPRAEAYGAAKSAIAYMINTLGITLMAENIDVSLVCPGFVKTSLTDVNDFPMPFLLSVEQASNAIRKGIEKRQKEIHFPKRFTVMMKLFALLPRSVWPLLAQRIVRK